MFSFGTSNLNLKPVASSNEGSQQQGPAIIANKNAMVHAPFPASGFGGGGGAGIFAPRPFHHHHNNNTFSPPASACLQDQGQKSPPPSPTWSMYEGYPSRKSEEDAILIGGHGCTSGGAPVAASSPSPSSSPSPPTPPTITSLRDAYSKVAVLARGAQGIVYAAVARRDLVAAAAAANKTKRKDAEMTEGRAGEEDEDDNSNALPLPQEEPEEKGDVRREEAVSAGPPSNRSLVAVKRFLVDFNVCFARGAPELVMREIAMLKFLHRVWEEKVKKMTVMTVPRHDDSANVDGCHQNGEGNKSHLHLSSSSSSSFSPFISLLSLHHGPNGPTNALTDGELCAALEYCSFDLSSGRFGAVLRQAMLKTTLPPHDDASSVGNGDDREVNGGGAAAPHVAEPQRHRHHHHHHIILIKFILYSLLYAVHCLHEVDAIHRDIKLSNVMVKRVRVGDGGEKKGGTLGGDEADQIVIKLGDFGSARKLTPTSNPNPTIIAATTATIAVDPIISTRSLSHHQQQQRRQESGKLKRGSAMRRRRRSRLSPALQRTTLLYRSPETILSTSSGGGGGGTTLANGSGGDDGCSNSSVRSSTGPTFYDGKAADMWAIGVVMAELMHHTRPSLLLRHTQQDLQQQHDAQQGRKGGGEGNATTKTLSPDRSGQKTGGVLVRRPQLLLFGTPPPTTTAIEKSGGEHDASARGDTLSLSVGGDCQNHYRRGGGNADVCGGADEKKTLPTHLPPPPPIPIEHLFPVTGELHLASAILKLLGPLRGDESFLRDHNDEEEDRKEACVEEEPATTTASTITAFTTAEYEGTLRVRFAGHGPRCHHYEDKHAAGANAASVDVDCNSRKISVNADLGGEGHDVAEDDDDHDDHDAMQFDLLCQLLVVDPRRRIAAQEALRHPYFSSLFALFPSSSSPSHSLPSPQPPFLIAPPLRKVISHWLGPVCVARDADVMSRRQWNPGEGKVKGKGGGVGVGRGVAAVGLHNHYTTAAMTNRNSNPTRVKLCLGIESDGGSDDDDDDDHVSYEDDHGCGVVNMRLWGRGGGGGGCLDVDAEEDDPASGDDDDDPFAATVSDASSGGSSSAP